MKSEDEAGCKARCQACHRIRIRSTRRISNTYCLQIWLYGYAYLKLHSSKRLLLRIAAAYLPLILEMERTLT